MNRFIREPLVHFLILGAVLFAIASFVDESATPADDRIVVTAGRIEHLATLFARTWQRPPTKEELDGLIHDYIREEAAYREGMAMELEYDDTIIRRRIRQKLDFIAEDLVGQVEPTDKDLRQYLAAHPDAFRILPVLTFRHVYFSPEDRGENLETDVVAAVNNLNDDRSIDIGGFGDRIQLKSAYEDASLRAIAATFGAPFATAIAEIEPGMWHGPVESGYGAHAVIVDKRAEGRIPDLDEVRDAVRVEWENARREEAVERFYRDMLDKYEITIEWPQPDSPGDGY